MQNRLEGVDKLTQGLFLDGRNVHQAYAVHLLGSVAKKVAVAVDRDAKLSATSRSDNSMTKVS